MLEQVRASVTPGQAFGAVAWPSWVTRDELRAAQGFHRSRRGDAAEVFGSVFRPMESLRPFDASMILVGNARVLDEGLGYSGRALGGIFSRFPLKPPSKRVTSTQTGRKHGCCAGAAPGDPLISQPSTSPIVTRSCELFQKRRIKTQHYGGLAGCLG